MYYVWIHCDFINKEINIYKEYDCGGEIHSNKNEIPKYIIEDDNVEYFIKWLDEECSFIL